MPCLPFTNLLIIFSIILISSSSNNADVSKPFELVDKFCSKQRNANFCLKVLKSDNRSKFAKNTKTLAKIVVDLATKSSTKTRDYFRGVKTGPPGVLKSLKDCIDAYNSVISNFKICLNEGECDLVSYDIKVASDDVARCQSIADDNGAHASFITTCNNVTQDFCSLGSSLADSMCQDF